MSTPRVVIGALLYNHQQECRETIESILGQTFTDFALVLVDDRSSDATPQIAQEYAALDSRVTYLRNPERLGLVGNSRRAFEIARQAYPEASYFAWASDHDLWHPLWLEKMVAALDRTQEVVLAYPLTRRIDQCGELNMAKRPWMFDTAGITDRSARLRRSIRGMSAGNMVYGLFRADTLERAGVYRRVLVPDRLLFTELSLYGQFAQVPQVLWFRRTYGKLFSLGRQRRSFFPGRRPLYAYAPWWISHAATLFWMLVVRGTGRPHVSRLAGLRAAVQCLFANAWLHAAHRTREVRTYLLDRSDWLRRLDSRLRLGVRASRERAKKRMKKLRKRGRHIGTELVRRPGLLFLKALRTIPVVRTRVVPSLLKQELDQIPAAPVVNDMRSELERLQETSGPILVGPWISEVGFELLYWIPFLNWAINTYGLDKRRLIVVSRGGARPWYRHLTHEYVDVFDLFPLDEYRRLNDERWTDLGHQKQTDVTPMEREILDRARKKLGLDDAELLHPLLMYRLLRFFWYEKAGASLLTKHTQYRRFARIEDMDAVNALPREYVAVRFYFRPSFPDTPENRAFAANIIRSLARQVPVVLLNTGVSVDDHVDLDVGTGKGVHRVDHLMTLQRNLDVQTQIISRARAFVGTYGGLTYLPPFYGVPSVGFYSTESELVPAHLDIGWRLGRAIGMSATPIDTRSVDLLQLLFQAPRDDARPVAVGAGATRMLGIE